MDEDPNVRWEQVDLKAIRPDGRRPQLWEAGRVNDVLVLNSGDVLIGTDSGGVWQIKTGVSGDCRVSRAADERLEIFVRGSDGHVWHLWQTTPNGDWNDAWEDLSTYRC